MPSTFFGQSRVDSPAATVVSHRIRSLFEVWWKVLSLIATISRKPTVGRPSRSLPVPGLWKVVAKAGFTRGT